MMKHINISVPFVWSEAVPVNTMKAYKGGRHISPLIHLTLALEVSG